MAQKYEKLVQEDLNVGTSRTWVQAPGGGKLCATQIGLHTVARGQRAYTASWTPGSISAGSKASTTVSVPDAAVGDFVMASVTTLGDTGLHVLGNVSAAGTVSVVIHNPTASAVSVSAGTVSVLVFGAYSIPAVLASIAGSVFVGEGGALPDVAMSLYLSSDTSTAIDTTTTDGSGNWSFTGLAGGTYYVRGVTGVYAGYGSVTIADGETSTGTVIVCNNPENPAWPPT